VLERHVNEINLKTEDILFATVEVTKKEKMLFRKLWQHSEFVKDLQQDYQA